MLFGGNFENLTGASNEKAKTAGLSRLWEIIMDNTTHFLGANFLCVLGALPLIIGILYALSTNNLIILALSTIFGGMLFCPFYAAMINGMLKAMRDETGDWFKNYCHALKRDFKDNLIPGLIIGLESLIVIYTFSYIQVGKSLPAGLIISVVISVIVLLAIYTYLLPQRVFFDLNIIHIIRNSVYMSMAHPLVTFASIAVQAIYWSVMFLLVPYSIIFMIVFGFWLPALLGMFVTYKQMNKEFHIEEKAEQAKNEKLSNKD